MGRRQDLPARQGEIALQIWKSKADHLINLVKPKAYRAAATYLRHMQKVYAQTDHLGDWRALLADLRTRHKAKRRLIEVLDALEQNRKLVE